MNLFVKWFKSLLFLNFLVISIGMAQTTTDLQAPQVAKLLDSISSETDKIFYNGEIYTVRIHSEKGDEELEGLEYKRITPVVYVMDFYVEDGERFFKVFVTNPPKKEEKIAVPFQLVDIEYKSTKKPPMMDFAVIESHFNLDKETKTYTIYYLVAGVLFLILLFFLLKFFRVQKERRALRRKRKDKASALIEQFSQAQERSDFEAIYKRRSEIRQSVDLDQKNFNALMESINKIQYQKQWTLEELEQIRSDKNKVDVIGIKVGI